MVNVWEGVGARKEAQDFCALWGVQGTVLIDEQGALVERLGIRGVPTNVLVDADGTIAAIGATTPHELEAAVRDLLGPTCTLDPPAGSPDDWHWQTAPEQIEEQLSLRVNREPEPR